MVAKRVVNIAHRGASGACPENTLAAFRRAIEIGADMIELDLRATADGVAVALHDATLDRTTSGSGRLAELTLAQVKELDAGSWFGPQFAGERVPTLSEVVSLAVGRIALLLELKESGVDEQAVAALRHRWDGGSLIGSFQDQVLAEVLRLAPESRTALIVASDPLRDEEVKRLIDRARGLGAAALSVSYRGITPALVEAAAQAGISLIAWTVDERDQMKRMMELGVSGITTNYPEVLRELLGRRPARPAR